MTLAACVHSILQGFGVHHEHYQRGGRIVRSPLTGEIIAHVEEADPASVAQTIERSKSAFLAWRSVPAPRRGEFVRILGEELRAAKAGLGELVTIEAGKMVSGGIGEVQAMIVIFEFTFGLSSQILRLAITRQR